MQAILLFLFFPKVSLLLQALTSYFQGTDTNSELFSIMYIHAYIER